MYAGYAQPGVTEDDILLELVMFMGVVCNEVTASQIVQTGLVGPLSALQPINCCLHWLNTSCQVLDNTIGRALWQEQACQLWQDHIGAVFQAT